MGEWTRDMVEARITEAADVLKQMPPVRLGGYFSTWPEILRSFGDRVGANPVPMRRPPPSPSAISRMWHRSPSARSCTGHHLPLRGRGH